MNNEKQMICPIMSCRVTRADADGKTMTPTIIKCQSDCALWDDGNKACSFKSMLIEKVVANG